MKNFRFLLLATLLLTSLQPLAARPARANEVPPGSGLIVCIGTDTLKEVSNDWKNAGCTFHCLETSAAKITNLRRDILASDCQGKVSVARFDGENLPYIDNLVNLLNVGDGFEIPEAELQRVLAPYGHLVVEGKRTTKPYPDEFDEWPQYLHGSDNNAVAKDTAVGPPRHVQWISGPAWTRSHMGAATISSMVTAGGRLFTIEDRATAENPFLPARWKLVARGAFNGVILWEMDFPVWEQITVHIKRFHAQMQRRLVATADEVYCTPGVNAPVTAVDAATGETLREFANTSSTQEFVLHDGNLFVVTGDRMISDSYDDWTGSPEAKKRRRSGKKSKKKTPAPEPESAAGKGAAPAANPDTRFGRNGFANEAYNPRIPEPKDPTNAIVAFDAATGEQLWRRENITYLVGTSLALKNGRLVYQTALGLTCLDAKTGAQRWVVEKEIRFGVGNRPNTLVLGEKAVYSEEGPAVFAYSLEDGSDYWKGNSLKARKGYMAASDLLIAQDALWMCGAGGVPTSYDLETGEQRTTIEQTLSKPMGHDRCFRNFITERFYINSKTGGPDCLDLAKGIEYPAPFTRATCSMGPLPGNGLIYSGPYACQCHLPTSLHNFNAYYTNEASLPTDGQVVEVERSIRLEKGPAYGAETEEGDAPWPIYRQDPRRYSGSTETVPGTNLTKLWTTRVGAKATPPVIAGGKVFLADPHTHTLHALDAENGESIWKYIV